MKVGNIVFWSRTAFNKVKVCTLVDNNEGVFKLASTCGVEAEIGLKGNFDFYALWHIDKGTSRPNRTVKSSKFVICRWNKLHKVFLDHIRIRTSECRLHIGVDNTHGRHFFLQTVIDNLRIVLGTDTCKRSLFSLWDAELFKGILDVFWHFLPLALHICVGTDIGDNFVHI